MYYYQITQRRGLHESLGFLAKYVQVQVNRIKKTQQLKKLNSYLTEVFIFHKFCYSSFNFNII